MQCPFYLSQTPCGARTGRGLGQGQCMGLSPRANAVSPGLRLVPELTSLSFKAFQEVLGKACFAKEGGNRSGKDHINDD